MKRRVGKKTSIGKVCLGQVPRVVAVIWGRGLVDLAVKAKEDGADLLEVRIDLFKKIRMANLKKDLVTIRKKIKLPVILTLRRKDEGGGRNYSGKERLKILKSLMPLTEAVDIELRSKNIIEDVIREAKRKRKKVLVSYHNLVETPRDKKLEDIICRAGELGANIIKIAARAKNKDDVIRLMNFGYSSTCHQPLVFISMGRMGTVISRVVAPFFGSCLAYAYVDKPAALGQLSVVKLKKRLKEIPL